MICKSYCRCCTSMCGTLIELDDADGRVLHIQGDREHPLTEGYTCSKGRDLPLLHHGADRLRYPKLGRGKAQRRVKWDEALDDLSKKLLKIIDESGPDSVGIFLGGGGYVDAGAYAVIRHIPQTIGTRSCYSDLSIDSIAKVAVGEMMVGVGGLMSRPDVGKCPLIVYAGTNPLVSHGHTAMLNSPTARMREFTAAGEVWVLDPRRTETAAKATRHLATKPGTDYAVFAFLVRELLQDGADEEYLSKHAQGRDALEAAVARFNCSHSSEISGIAQDVLADFLTAVRRAGKLSIELGTGLTMAASGNVTQWLAWALMIITGSLDREGGAWVNPGFLTQLDKLDMPLAPETGWVTPGPRSRPELRAMVGEFPAAALPDEIEAGNLRALINTGGNLAISMPAAERTIAALKKLDVLATVEVRDNETTELSTHVLPSKDQLERADLTFAVDVSYPVIGMSYTPAIAQPTGEIKSFWWILAQLGKRMGMDFWPGVDPDTGTDEEVMDILLSRGRSKIDTRLGSQYVVAEERTFGWLHEYAKRIGGWRLAPSLLVEQLEELEPPGELTLISRRQAYRMNSRAYGDRDRPLIHVNAHDAGIRDFENGDRAILRSPHGQMEGELLVDPTIGPGIVQVPHGWSGEHNVNLITSADDVDPITGMPRFSGLPVELVHLDEV